MKKTILSFGLALLTLTTASASNMNLAQSGSEITTLYSATPLCVAISKGDIETVKKFVEYGANVNEKSNGLTPLMIAATYNRVDIIKYLLANGADTKIKNDSGFTALKFAQMSNASEAAAALSGDIAK